MGLGMYFTSRKHLSVYDPKELALSQKISELLGILKEGKILTNDDHNSVRASEVNISTGYLRNANQIHNWIVENVADGDDSCQEIYLSVDVLEALKDVCKQVIADPSKASELLPAQSGFFFGDTDYDEWYMSDVKETLSIVNTMLEDEVLKTLDHYYQASW